MAKDVVAVIRSGIEDIRRSGVVCTDRVLDVGVALPNHLGGVALRIAPKGMIGGTRPIFRLCSRTKVPWSIHIDNDAAAAAIGEARFGSGCDHVSFFYILVSARLSGGIVIDGTYCGGANARCGGFGSLPSPHIQTAYYCNMSRRCVD